MELNHLRYFREIAREGSITAAARKLGLTQPTLSVAVQNLEEELGTVLLIRHRGGVELTDAGTVFMQHTDEVFAALERAAATIAGLGNELVGQFVFACNESLGAYFLPHVLPRLLEAAPRLQLILRTANSPSVLSAVVERQVHYGIVVNPQPHPDLVMLRLFSDAVDFFVRDESAAPPDRCATDDLAEAHRRICTGPLLYASRVPQCGQMLEQLQRVIAPPRLVSCGDFELIRSLALAGLGVAMMPRRVAARSNGALRRLHDALPHVRDEIVLVYRGDMPKTRAALFVKDTVLQCARAIPSVGI